MSAAGASRAARAGEIAQTPTRPSVSAISAAAGGTRADGTRAGGRRLRRWAAPAAGAAVLAVLVWHVGAGPFLRGITAVDGANVAAAVVLAAVATAAAAARWTVLARRFGARLSWREAVAAYYRSQFVNSVVPGGILGDAGRAVSHGRRSGDLGAAARAVVAERAAGQLVQIVLAGALLMTLTARGTLTGAFDSAALVPPAVVAGVVAFAGVGVILLPAARRAVGRELATVRSAFASWRVALVTVVTSAVVVASHTATLLIAVDRVAPGVPVTDALAPAVIVLLAASIPLNVGGWGPREGAAGWAFALAGLTAPAGVAASTLFGVLALLGVAPGAVLVVIAALQHLRVGGRKSRRPWVTSSAAVSLDGCLDTAAPPRLILSNAADLDRVDGVRAEHDAILVGAGTLRTDNPRLLVRDPARRAARVSAGRTSTPLRVTVTATGDLDPDAAFFTQGPSERLVFCPAAVAPALRRRLHGRATVVGLPGGDLPGGDPRGGRRGGDPRGGRSGGPRGGQPRGDLPGGGLPGGDLPGGGLPGGGPRGGRPQQVAMTAVVDELGRRGVTSLMVEGGSRVLAGFLEEDLIDELHLAVAPIVVGDPAAPRFPATSRLDEGAAPVLERRRLGEVEVTRYALSARAAAAGSARDRSSGSNSWHNCDLAATAVGRQA